MTQKIIEKQAFATWTKNIKESEIRRLLRFNPKYYLAGGLPGNQPITSMKQILTEIIEELPMTDITKSPIFNYGSTEGNPMLREVLMKRMKEREGIRFPSGISDISISTGSQQSLYGILKVLLNPGDVVIASCPTYLGFIGPVETLGGRIITVASDTNGIIPEALNMACEKAIQKYKALPKLLYVQTFSENPTGITLSDKRKREIYNIALQYKITILEDAAYKEIHQFDTPQQPMKAFDSENKHIIYTSTTSKEAAVLRVAYNVIPEDISREFIKLKGFMDLCTPSITQEIALKYYRNYIDDSLKEINNAYNKQRNAMKAAIDEFLPGTRTDPCGGFFIWYKQEGINTKSILEEALRNDVLYVPGYAFYPSRGDHIDENIVLQNSRSQRFDEARLSFSATLPNDIKDGVEILSKIFT